GRANRAPAVDDVVDVGIESVEDLRFLLRAQVTRGDLLVEVRLEIVPEGALQPVDRLPCLIGEVGEGLAVLEIVLDLGLRDPEIGARDGNRTLFALSAGRAHRRRARGRAANQRDIAGLDVLLDGIGLLLAQGPRLLVRADAVEGGPLKSVRGVALRDAEPTRDVARELLALLLRRLTGVLRSQCGTTARDNRERRAESHDGLRSDLHDTTPLLGTHLGG